MQKLLNLHWHSILCHVPCALLPLSGLAYVAGRFLPSNFFLFVHGAFIYVSLFSFLPVMVSGFLSHEQKYANWTRLFKAKTALSVLLFLVCSTEAALLIPSGAAKYSFGFALLAVAVGPLLSVVVTLLGHITTQGKFGGRENFILDPDASVKVDIVKELKAKEAELPKEEWYDRI